MKRKVRFSKFSESRYRSMGVDPVKAADFFVEAFPSGELVTEEVIELARPKTSPIHNAFTWDIKAAAQKCWTTEARELIRSLVVEIDGEEVRQYVSPVLVEPDDTYKKYLALDRAMANESIWAQVLERAMRELLLWRKQYFHLKELGPVVNAIDKLEAKLNKEEGKKR